MPEIFGLMEAADASVDSHLRDMCCCRWMHTADDREMTGLEEARALSAYRLMAFWQTVDMAAECEDIWFDHEKCGRYHKDRFGFRAWHSNMYGRRYIPMTTSCIILYTITTTTC